MRKRSRFLSLSLSHTHTYIYIYLQRVCPFRAIRMVTTLTARRCSLQPTQLQRHCGALATLEFLLSCPISPGPLWHHAARATGQKSPGRAGSEAPWQTATATCLCSSFHPRQKAPSKREREKKQAKSFAVCTSTVLLSQSFAIAMQT